MLQKYAPLILVVVVAVGLLYTATIMKERGQTAPPTLAGADIGGAYTLINQYGEEVTETSFPGKYQFIYFGFSTCPDICPTELHKMADVLDGLGDMKDRLAPIFITVDPARDTPEQLKEYMNLFHPDFVGLTGTEAQIDHVIDLYKVYASKVEPEDPNKPYLIDHSSYIYLMDPEGVPLALYKKSDTAEYITQDIKNRLTQ